MARTKVDKSSLEIEMMIDRRARNDAKVRKDLLLLGRKVHRYWRRIAPVGDPSGARYVENFGGPLPKHWQQNDPKAGSYKAGIIHRRGKKVNGFPTRVISATDWKSHWIEYGTGGDTPTPEFACRQRTATRFGAMGKVAMRIANVNMNRKSGVAKSRGAVGLDISGTPEGKVGKSSGYEGAA